MDNESKIMELISQETERQHKHQPTDQQQETTQSGSRQGVSVENIKGLNLFAKPASYFERQKQAKIKFADDSPFKNMGILENKIIGFSGVPGSGKTTICLHLIQDILDNNSNYKTILFSLELNRGITLSKLAKVPVNLPENTTQEEAEAYAQKDRDYIKKYITDGKRVGMIDSQTKTEDLKAIEMILESYDLTANDNQKINTYQELMEYRKQEESREKLIILIDYYDIMRTGEDKEEYQKQAHIIEELKRFRDKYKFVTFFIINSMNKEGMKAGGSQTSIKGNSAIIYGYDQSFSIEKIDSRKLDFIKKIKEDKKKHRFQAGLINYSTMQGTRAEETEDNQPGDKIIYSDESIIIVEDVKNRYGRSGVHILKAVQGFAGFIEITDLFSSEGAGKAEGKIIKKKEIKKGEL